MVLASTFLLKDLTKANHRRKVGDTYEFLPHITYRSLTPKAFCLKVLFRILQYKGCPPQR
jgi:hypothetical protein